MPRKIDQDKTHGDKLITLFALLLFSGKSFSLTDLARRLNCSKPTVTRLANAITLSYSVPLIEETIGNQKYFRIERSGNMASMSGMSQMESALLQMSMVFTRHMLGQDHFNQITHAMQKSSGQESFPHSDDQGLFKASRTGTIDYTPHEKTLASILKAMNEERVCRLRYLSVTSGKLQTLTVEPLRLFTHRETVYLLARLSARESVTRKRAMFDPILAIHRIQKIEVTDETFIPPPSLDFDGAFNRHFGLMQGQPFRVEVKFTGWAASYVADRLWSEDQDVIRKSDGSIILRFTVTSEPEVVSWVLSYGNAAQVLKPESIRTAIINTAVNIKKSYSPS